MASIENANDEIWIMRRGEWPALQLTDNDWAWDKHPSWSSDGSQIIYSSNRGDGRLRIWVMDADGGNQRPLTNFPFEAWDPVCRCHFVSAYIAASVQKGLTMKHTCLAIIPARGGSKGIPRKNIRPIGGKPLIAWTIETALACPTLDRVIVSTDDSEIADVARQFGADVPFVRPSELAMDDTPDFPVFTHALSWLKQHDSYEADIAAWLRPTTPLRSVEDIISATDILINKKASCVRSVVPVEHHPYWMKTVDQGLLQPFIAGRDENRYYRRQMLPPAYRLNGAIDVVRCSYALESGQLFGGVMAGYVMPPERSIDIDTEFDFSLAEIVLTKGLV